MAPCRVEDVLARLAPDGVTRWLARTALGVLKSADRYELHCRQVLLDWCGVVLGGRTELPSTNLGPAFEDAAAAHVLDYDDVNNDIPGHSSATVIAAALAVARRSKTSLSTVWQAILAGSEAACRLGLLCGSAQYERGWHPTATIGSVGSAIAAGIVLGFNEDQLTSAIALASLQSSGALVAFGSVGKSWQTGCAARNGVHASQAVAAGYRTDEDYLGQAGGVLDLMATWRHRNTPAALYDPTPRIKQTVYKRYATCFATHAAEHCAEDLAAGGVRADEVEAVTVALGPQFSNIVAHRAPTTSLEAKFSVSTVVAMTLAGHAPRAIEDLAPERLADPALRELEQVVTLQVDDSLKAAAARVSVRLAETNELHVVQHGEPTALNVTDTWPILREKFRALAVPVLGQQEAEELVRIIETAPGEDDADRLASLLAAGHRQ